MHITRRHLEKLKDILNVDFKINSNTPPSFESVTLLET